MSSPNLPKEVTDRRYRLLPSVLEHIADTTPERIYAAVPKSPDLTGGLHEITFGKVRNAINSFAWYLKNTFGASDAFETLTYVGVDDLRYVVFFFACIKTGYKSLFVSPRLTPDQNARLVTLTECRHFFYGEEVAAVANAFGAAAEGMKTHEMKPFEYWASIESEPMPYRKTFEEAKLDPVLVLHSSGSTGPPKTVTQTHQWLINNQKEYEGRPVVGMSPYNFEDGGYFLGVFPFFHLAGFFLACAYPVYSHSAAILLRPTSRPPTPELLFGLMRMCRVRTLAVPPSIVEGLAKLPQGIEQLAGLDYIHYAGGPLEKSCGDLLSKTVHVCSTFGTSETGHILTYMPTSADWQFFEFHPAHNVVLEDEGDGTFELVLYQDKAGACNRPIDGTILRTESVWRSKDLFEHDPERPHLWRYCGRKDDIIVFSNGQKWNPVPTEALIQTGAKADGVLVAGEGHAEPALLIERADYEDDPAALVEQVWPVVEDANSQTQRYGRISRSRIAFVKPGMFVRTGKGTIVRRTSLAILQSTLDRLYDEDAGGPDGYSIAQNGDGDSKEPLSASLIDITRGCVHQVKTVKGAKDDEDLFLRGLDSLEAAEIARSLKVALRPFATTAALKFVDGSFVFQNPTVEWLAGALRASLTGEASTSRPETVAFSSLLAKYQATIDATTSNGSSGTRGFAKVGITGSTGSLGTHIMGLLLSDRRISEVVCLNRSANLSASSEKPKDVPGNKISTLIVDFTKPNLGLADGDAQALSGLDVIIHCAWEVNFNRSLATFEAQVRTLVDLAKISQTGIPNPRIVFISSVSAADDDSPEVLKHGYVPETVVTEPEISPRMGYAVSKNLGEHLLAFAAEKHGLPTTVIRVGQIAGSTKLADPAWNRKEWLPSLIDTSASLKCLPKELPAVDWVPIDVCARTILDIVVHDAPCSGFRLYNVVNPKPSTWLALALAVQARLGNSCKLVSFGEWVEKLKERNDGSEESLRLFPSLKLLPFFEKSAMKTEAGRRVSTVEACKASPSLAGLDPIGKAEMDLWMTQWGHK